MKKPIVSKYKINSLVRYRWSPRAFDDRQIEKEKIVRLLEAARWAPSAFNEQPWRFIVGLKGGETFESLLNTLVEWNQKWAGKAPLLILNIAKKTFTRNSKPNATYTYDLGQAVAFMCLEAMNLGIYSHQMSGFSKNKASQLFQIPDDFEPISVTAFGYYGDPKSLAEDMYDSEMAERSRKGIDELVFTGNYNDTGTF